MVRGFHQMAAPAKAGTWSKIVNQPYYPPPVKAQKLLFHGQYADAEALYNTLLKSAPDNQEYLENDLESVLLEGHASNLTRFNEKCQALTEKQRSTAKMTRLRGEALLESGHSAQATALLKAFVDGHPKLDPNDGETVHLFVDYGKVLERAAQYTAAEGIYNQVVATVPGDFPTDSQAATQIAYALYRGSTLAGEGRDKHRMVMYQLAQVRTEDQTYWPAMLVEAEVLMATHNDGETGAALAQVQDLNPNEIQTRFLSMDHAISEYNFEAAQQQLTELKQRTDVAEVSAYEGRLLLKERLPEKAVAPLLDAVSKDPTLAEARGWLAGAYYLTNNQPGMEKELSAIRVGEREHPVALFEAAEILRDARQFVTAEKMYLQAEESAPWWSEPPAALAQLYLEMGLEKEAKAAYEKAYAMDPYNMRAINQLKLLEVLQKFASKESETRLKPGSNLPAFIVRYDPKEPGNEILATMAVQWMEKVRPELWSYFQITELPAPTVIEFFPNHQEFGVRTTGLPWIGTVGASTGNVIALDVPRGGAKNMMGPFDWARVLRHEYTHTITLAMTNNRIPHWLTEAAAVNQEQSPRDWENCQLLCSNYRAGTLFKIADLNWGFIRPKRSIDRQLAYMQSQWLYEYLVTTYGLPKMLDFLHCFHDSLTEPEAWKKTYNKTPEEMDKEFLAWAGKQIESWGLPSDPLPKRPDVEEALKKNPDDADALYKMAWLMASGGDNKGARENLEKLVKLKPDDLKAREMLGGVLQALKEKDKAREILEAVVKEDAKRPVALRTLGLIAMADANYDEAARWFTQLQAVRPLEDTSYTNLAGIYLATHQSDKAIGQLLELERHDQYDDRIPRKLADLYLDGKNLPDAEAAAFRAIRINPFNAIDHELLAQVLAAEGKPAQAAVYWNYATTLQPKVAEFWEGLADSKGDSGDAAGAAAAAKKALELQPNSKAAKWIK